MAENNRPRRRETNVTEGGLGVHRRDDEGLGTGKVGSGSGTPQQSSGRNVKRAGGIGGGLIALILAVLLGTGGLGNLFGGGSSTPAQQPSSSGSSLPAIQSVLSAPVSNSWGTDSNIAKLNETVAPGARQKYTTLMGNGQDTVTLMVYMCGTDLESKYGMATKDLMEMASATLSNKVNILVFTGGCKQWKNQAVSNQVNQIYRVAQGGLETLVADAGTAAMTDPNNLASFIQWCGQNFPASRNMLIFWDHGAGSLQGYGYDEKNVRSGSMSLAQIDSALKAANMKFDFIGFDACLMATAENALMLSKYADYMIASEETEPGVGWYYTNWLTTLSNNTSTPTIQIGKQIVDDFVDVCAQQCRGQQTTLSVVDLAELSGTMGDAFTAFSNGTKSIIASNGYQTVSRARSNTREFAGSSSIDQIDLVHFAKNLGTDEAKKLADVLLSAVKYNRAANITNAYGLSIYFPYKKVAGVDTAVATYDRIGLDSAYSDCIREFANLEVSGQVSAGGTGSALPSLLGQLMSGGTTTATQSASGAQDIAQLLNLFMGGGRSSINGLSEENTAFMTGRSIPTEQAAEYIADHRLNPANLVWTEDGGQHKIILPEEQWEMVQGLDLNVFFDDGTGYIDLGLDNTFDFDDAGNLIGETDGTWLSINSQPVAYYHLSTAEEGEHYTITGYVPVLLNGERMDLILIFNDENPYGYIAGARPVYEDTDAVARGLAEVNVGDTLDFLCDYYSYDGVYQDSYKLGEQQTVTANMQISNTRIDASRMLTLYRFTDLYNQQYWTLPVPTE